MASVVSEGDYAYIIVRSSYDNRQLDASDECGSICPESGHAIVGEYIAVNSKFEQVLFISQFDFMLKKIEPMQKLEALRRLHGRHKLPYYRAQIYDKILDKKHNYTVDFVPGSTKFSIKNREEITEFSAEVQAYRIMLWNVYLQLKQGKTVMNNDGDIGIIL